MKPSVFLKRVRQYLRSIDSVFYKECIHRQDRFLLRRAEEVNRNYSGESLRQVDDPDLRLIWAIQLRIQDHIIDKLPSKRGQTNTVKGVGEIVHSFFALGMVSYVLQLTFLQAVTKGLNLEEGAVFGIADEWQVVGIPVDKKKDLDRIDIFHRMNALLGGIMLLQEYNLTLQTMLVSFGHGDADMPPYGERRNK